MDKIELESLISEVTSAIIGTQSILQKTKMEHFLSYFEQRGEQLVACSKDIVFPVNESGDIKQSRISVPLATLVSHNNLALEEVEITIHTSITGKQEKLMAGLKKMSTEKEKELEGNVCRDGDCDIKLVLKNKEPAQGINDAISIICKGI